MARRLKVLEWHEDAIDLPPGAQLLASSAQCEQQMYRVGPTRVGLQFHPEWNAESVAMLNEHFARNHRCLGVNTTAPLTQPFMTGCRRRWMSGGLRP